MYGAGYVDEFILAANPNDDVHYLHQDANYNLIAQTDESGAVMYQSTYSHRIRADSGGPRIITAGHFYTFVNKNQRVRTEYCRSRVQYKGGDASRTP